MLRRARFLLSRSFNLIMLPFAFESCFLSNVVRLRKALTFHTSLNLNWMFHTEFESQETGYKSLYGKCQRTWLTWKSKSHRRSVMYTIQEVGRDLIDCTVSLA